jgi:D-3-phosphoglycerate dehydrogenase / 2-oxoglutarate reductase
MKTSNRILTSPSSFGQIDQKPNELLKNKHYEPINNPYGRKLTESETIKLAGNCLGVVAGVESYNASVIDNLPNLKCISRVGVGMDSIDLDYAKSKGIFVVNTPDGPTRSVAEFTIGMTFSILRRIPQADSAIKKGCWEKQTGNLLYGKTIGVIGLGRIGRMVSEMFRGLGNNIVGYDLFPDKYWAKEHNVKLVDLNSLLDVADIVTVHIPGSTDSLPVIAFDELNRLKKGGFLINISRGNVVDEQVLYELLESNHLAGAAIDVYSKEPYTGPLCDLNNIILTPHIGSYAAEGKLQMEIDAVRNLIEVMENKLT